MMRNGETRALRGMPGILLAAAAVIFLSLTVGVVVAAIFLLATVYCLITEDEIGRRFSCWGF